MPGKFTFQNPRKFSLKVFNSLAQVITESANEFEQKEIQIQLNTASWVKGTYIVQMITNDETITRKIIK